MNSEQRLSLVNEIRDTFGEDIADEANLLLDEEQNRNLPWLALIAAAENRLYQRRYAGLAQMQLNSFIEVQDNPASSHR